MAKTKKPLKLRVSLADQARLGPEVAAVKARTKPAEWKAIVKSAHARGFSVAGVLSGAPDALKERTRSSLVDEAKKTVTAAYQPAAQELGYQESKVKALDAKRQQDETHFQAWLSSKQQTMASQALTADAELERRQADIQAQTQQGYATAQAAVRQNAAAQAGNVSDPTQSKALDLSPDAARANEQVANARQQSASMTNNAAGRAVAGIGVSTALSQEATRRRTSETAGALSDLGAKRSDLFAKMGADAAAEISRLYGVEINKADANRNYTAAAQKLGVDQMGLELDARKADDAVKIADKRIGAQIDIANQRNSTTLATTDARNQIDLYRIKTTAQQKKLDRELRIKLKTTTGKDVPASSVRLSNQTSTKLSQVAADINRSWGKKDKVHVAGKTQPRHGRTLRQVITGAGVSSTEYELALDLARHGKLSPINKRRAKALGILNPEDL